MFGYCIIFHQIEYYCTYQVNHFLYCDTYSGRLRQHSENEGVILYAGFHLLSRIPEPSMPACSGRKKEKGCYFLGLAAAGFLASCFFAAAGAFFPVFVLFAAAFVSFLGITMSIVLPVLSRA